MNNYELKNPVVAEEIKEIQGCCITLKNKDEINVTHEWVGQNSPQAGMMLVEKDHTYSVVPKNGFDEKYIKAPKKKKWFGM